MCIKYKTIHENNICGQEVFFFYIEIEASLEGNSDHCIRNNRISENVT